MSDLDDAIRTMIRRARLTADADDSEFQQRTDLAGLSGDQPGRVHRFQQPGVSHVPVKGAEGFLLSLGGRSDRSVFFGGETEGKRPTGYAPGDTVLYDNHGNIVSLVQQKLRIVHATEIVLQVGSVSMTMTTSGVTFCGGTIKHDGKSIDKNHIHGGVTSGSSNTAVPAN